MACVILLLEKFSTLVPLSSIPNIPPSFFPLLKTFYCENFYIFIKYTEQPPEPPASAPVTILLLSFIRAPHCFSFLAGPY